MKKFTLHTGVIAPLDICNVDTDAIIPKQFLQKIDRTGFSDDLFFHWRCIGGDKNNINKNFFLNKLHYKKSSILITRDNFGCGSSREHAVWALLDYGFKCIIAPNFADIFYSNSFNNGLLLITLNKSDIDNIFNIIYNHPGIQSTVSLKKNFVFLNGEKYSFKIDDFYRYCLLHGLDSIDLTLKHECNILKYEKNIPIFLNNN